LLREEVTEEDIAEVVSSWTGIPGFAFTGGRAREARKARGALHLGVVGQDEAIKAVSNAVAALVLVCRTQIDRWVHSFFSDPWRWQTELARARGIFVRRRKRHDPHRQSEYMEKHNGCPLIGAPPGYVGYEKAATSEAVRRKPYSSCSR